MNPTLLLGLAALSGSHEQLVTALEEAITDWKANPSESNFKALATVSMIIVTKVAIGNDPKKLIELTEKGDTVSTMLNTLDKLS